MIPMMELENISRTYSDKRVLQSLCMRVSEGENLLLTGPSGCGKSTLLRLIAGLEAPEEGCIRIAGETVSAGQRLLVAPHLRGIAMLFQDLGLWPNLSVLGNVILGLYSHKISRAEKLAEAHAVLESCEIADLSSRMPAQISVGEQQRVALARALVIRPKILLLDEPFTALDLLRKVDVVRQVRAMCETLHTTVVLVSHDLADAPLLSARIAVLEDGAICEEGTLGQLTLHSQSRTLAAWKERSEAFETTGMHPR